MKKILDYWPLATAVIAVAFLVFGPPIRQDPLYHSFADQRTIWGIPNFWNVVSNAPFLIPGIAGLLRFREAASRVMFAGITLVAVGSGYYHWAPSDATLVWDRLPMTLVFMSITAIALEEVWERKLLAPLVLFGVASVAWWAATGDLKAYGVAQFGPVLLLVPAGVVSPALRALWPVGFFYVAAKLAESYDAPIYHVFPLSGHTLKHFLAVLATYWIYRWNSTFCAMAKRNPAPPPAGTPTAG